MATQPDRDKQPLAGSADESNRPALDAGNDARNERRRRLLRLAAAGTPLLLGSATASGQAFGSIGACIEKCATQTPPIGAIPDSDNWVREVVGVFVIGVRSESPTGPPQRVTAYKIGSQYYPLDPDGTFPYGIPLLPGLVPPPWDDSELVGVQVFQRREAVLVNFSSSAGPGGVTVTPLGMAPTLPGGAPLTVSCLNSVLPGAFRLSGRFFTGV